MSANNTNLNTTPQNINDDEFEQEVENSALPVLVDFWAEWCGPCKQLSPIMDELARDLQGKLKIVKINIDDNTETPSKYGVKGIPTMILFKEGKQVAVKVGALPKSHINEWLETYIDS
jgi:thioredoxin 1